MAKLYRVLTPEEARNSKNIKAIRARLTAKILTTAVAWLDAVDEHSVMYVAVETGEEQPGSLDAVEDQLSTTEHELLELVRMYKALQQPTQEQP